MEYLSIDRFEGDLAVCEDDLRQKHEIHLSEITGNPKEGDVIRNQDGTWKVDQQETENGGSRF